MVQKTVPLGTENVSSHSPGSRGAKRLEAATARERLEAVRVWLLGGFQVAVGSRTLGAKQWRLRKAADLVKVLALAPKHRLPRERAIELLWPGFGKEAASNNLRQTLYAARKTFDAVAGSRYLAPEDRSLVLCSENERALAATRLLTFTGAGGSGKTRFALAENVQTGTLREEITNLAPVNDDVHFFQGALKRRSFRYGRLVTSLEPLRKGF